MSWIDVPADRYWVAQTQRSIHHFSIGWPEADRMPIEVVRAQAILKKAAAIVNRREGRLSVGGENFGWQGEIIRPARIEQGR